MKDFLYFWSRTGRLSAQNNGFVFEFSNVDSLTEKRFISHLVLACVHLCCCSSGETQNDPKRMKMIHVNLQKYLYEMTYRILMRMKRGTGANQSPWDDFRSAASLDQKYTAWPSLFIHHVYCWHKSKTPQSTGAVVLGGAPYASICSFSPFMVFMFLVFTVLLNRVNRESDCCFPGKSSTSQGQSNLSCVCLLLY